MDLQSTHALLNSVISNRVTLGDLAKYSLTRREESRSLSATAELLV